ncbi:MAG: D-aminoacyl-tRNA deacylase, partial [Verrucomicrobiales bacterium]
VFLTNPGPLVETMRAAVKSATGREPALTTGGGTSDARFIQAYCPVIEFGLINETIHAVDERVAVADLVKLTEIYERFIAALRSTGLRVETGEFGAMMQVALINDGPVTIWLDSRNRE